MQDLVCGFPRRPTLGDSVNKAGYPPNTERPKAVAPVSTVPQSTTLATIQPNRRRRGAPRSRARTVPRGAPTSSGDSSATPGSPYPSPLRVMWVDRETLAQSLEDADFLCVKVDDRLKLRQDFIEELGSIG